MPTQFEESGFDEGRDALINRAVPVVAATAVFEPELETVGKSPILDYAFFEHPPELLADRRLPNLAVPEKQWVRLLWIGVAACLLYFQFYLIKSYWAPSNPGVDQNGYQVGGKLFAQGFTTGFKPSNPFTYVGWMWVQTSDGWVYPKYPLGIPVLDAICIWLAPTMHQGIVWSYLISPVSTVLAAAAVFLMIRLVAGSFAAILGLILMAGNPVALILSVNSNSHAPALAFSTWGILFLLWWMRYGSWWRGLIAGCLLGYGVTIRYTEGLLILPIAAAYMATVPYQRPRDIRWWAVGLWLILAIGGIVLPIATHMHVDGWRTYLPLIMATVATTLIVRMNTADRAGPQAYIIEFARSLICALMVWGIVRGKLPNYHWKDPADETIVGTIVILLMAAVIPFIYAIHLTRPRTYLRPAIVFAGWLIPVAALIAFNHFAMGSVTGYDTTNESEGFSWKYASEKWTFMVSQLYNTGLFFIVPLGIAGMFLMFRASARVALVMMLWFVPGLLLYTGYYWGLNMPGVSFLRFFLTCFPPIIFCTAWLLDYATRHSNGRGGAIAAPIAGGIIVLIASLLNVNSILGPLERDFTLQYNLADTADHIIAKTKDNAPAQNARPPILFGDARQLLNFIQYAGNFECYAADVFTTRGGMRRFGGADPDAPNPLQKARIDAMHTVYDGKSDEQLWAEGKKIVNDALADHRRVFIAMPSMSMSGLIGRFSSSNYKVTVVDRWREPMVMSDLAKTALQALGPMAIAFSGASSLPRNWELSEVTIKPPAPVSAAVKPFIPAKPTTMPASHKPALFEIK